jgi:hypothetical protein
MSVPDVVPSELRGFVEVSCAGGPFGIAGYSRSAERLPFHGERGDGRAVTNVKRARWIGRTFHDCDIPSESELRRRRMAGR